VSLDNTAAVTFIAAVLAGVGHAAAPEPWDIAAVVFACITGGLSLAVYAAARSNGHIDRPTEQRYRVKRRGC
jgi:hypothetical protein